MAWRREGRAVRERLGVRKRLGGARTPGGTVDFGRGIRPEPRPAPIARRADADRADRRLGWHRAARRELARVPAPSRRWALTERGAQRRRKVCCNAASGRLEMAAVNPAQSDLSA